MTETYPKIERRLEDQMELAARQLSYDDGPLIGQAKFRLFEGAAEIRKLKSRVAELEKQS